MSTVQPMAPGSKPVAAPPEQVIINDPTFVTLSAVPSTAHQPGSLYDLKIMANDPHTPIEVSYLELNPNGTPEKPATELLPITERTVTTTLPHDKHVYYHTEVNGWAQPRYKPNPQVIPLSHYRTGILMLARYEKVYLVVLRENDRRVGFQVFRGGAFNGMEIPGLGKVTRKEGKFEIASAGGPVEVGIWDKGAYTHDEVAGTAQPPYKAPVKQYEIPKYGLFMLMIARYGKVGLICGNMNDGRLGTVVFTGGQELNKATVPNLCTIVHTGRSGQQVTVTAETGPVEVTEFGFNNQGWQWEVNGWAVPGFKPNPQTFKLEHYTPGLFMVSRYEKMGIFAYNENDGQIGFVPLKPATRTS